MKTSNEKEKKLVLALSKLKSLNYKNPTLANDLQNLNDQKNQLEIEKKQIETKYGNLMQDYEQLEQKLDQVNKDKENKQISKELKLYTTTLKLSKTLKSNKDLTYRVLAQIASSVPKRVRFDEVDYNGKYTVTIQGIASSDQDILKFIENLGKKSLIDQASLSSMRLPRQTVGGATMKGFRVFVKIKRG